MNLFKEHRILRHKQQGEAALYVCLERLEDGKFAVQQVEFFTAVTLKRAGEEAARIAAQTLELFAETSPNGRCSWHVSLLRAIEAHDRDFGNMS